MIIRHDENNIGTISGRRIILLFAGIAEKQQQKNADKPKKFVMHDLE